MKIINLLNELFRLNKTFKFILDMIELKHSSREFIILSC